MAHRTRHRIAPLRLLQPRSFAEARRLLDEWPGALPMAGGLDVINRLKDGAGPDTLVWLGGIAEADVLRWEGSELVIAAGCRNDQIAQDAGVQKYFPDLAAAWGQIANIRLRSQGTIGGNLMAYNPGYEAAILLAASAARLAFLQPGGRRVLVAASELGDEDGCMRPQPGLMTHVHVPAGAPGQRCRLLYDRTLRPALSVALGLDFAGDHVCAARAVIGGCHPVPGFRHLGLQDLACRAGGAARAAFAGLPPPRVPWRGSVGYRERVAPVLLQRLIERAVP